MNSFFRILIAISILSIVLIAQIVFAQSLPAQNPPAGNVAPIVQSLETLQNTEIGGTLKLGNTLEPISGTTLGLKGNVNISKSLDVATDATINGKLTLPGILSADQTKVQIEKDATFTGKANFMDTVFVEKQLATNKLIINDMLNVTKGNENAFSVFLSNLNVQKKLTVNQGIQTDTIESFKGDPLAPVTMKSPLTINGKLQVNTLKAQNTPQLIVDDSLKVNEALNVDGSFTANVIGKWALAENKLDLKTKGNGFHSVVAVCPKEYTIVSCNSNWTNPSYSPASSTPPVFNLGAVITPNTSNCTATALKFAALTTSSHIHAQAMCFNPKTN